MDHKKKSMFVLASAILLFIGSVFSLLLAVAGMIWSDYSIYILEIALQTYLPSGYILDYDALQIALYFVLFSFVFSGVIGLVLGGFFLKRSRLSEGDFYSKKTSYIVALVITFIFYGNLLICILLLVPLFSSPKPKPLPEVEGGTLSDSKTQNTSESSVIEEIAKLKKLKESGAITEAEYNVLLAKIIK